MDEGEKRRLLEDLKTKTTMHNDIINEHEKKIKKTDKRIDTLTEIMWRKFGEQDAELKEIRLMVDNRKKKNKFKK